MKKNVSVCFRTSSDVRNALQHIADDQRMSVSAIIESIICRQLKTCRERDEFGEERRRFERKKVSLPAFIGTADAKAFEFETGSILDLSLNGIRFSLADSTVLSRHADMAQTEFNVIFTLPNERRAVKVRCLPKQIHDLNGEVHIGAAFVDADFTSCQALQQYLN